ncbi:MAG: PAS domain S-box protein, partial [Burkholderiaceae bacterium]
MHAAHTSPAAGPGDGPGAGLLHACDWTASPLGEPSGWPAALRVVAGLMLDSGMPMFVVWGPQRVLLYNQAYIPLLGQRHPAALGRPMRDVWGEGRGDVGNEIGLAIERAIAGESFHVKDRELAIERDGLPERAWFTFRYAPVRDEHGVLRGMTGSAVDTTERVVAARRQALLLSLTDALRRLSDPRAILCKAAELIGRYLGVNRMMYGEADTNRNTVTFHSHFTDGSVPPLNGTFALDEFGTPADVIARGESLVLDDIDTDPRIGSADVRERYADVQAHAILSAPVLRQDGMITFLTANHSGPRRWTADEIAIVGDVAQRTRSAVEHAHAEENLRRLNQTLEERVAARTDELERARREALHAAARLQFTLEAARIGDWDLDLVDGSTHRSPRHDQCFGYAEPIAEWSIDAFLNHVHPDDRGDVGCRFRHALDESGIWHFECRVVWPDRSVHWIAAHGSVYRIDGRPVRLSGIVADITKRKQAEERLRLLDRIGEATRAAADPSAIMAVTTRLLGTHLHATRCAYADVASDNDRFTIRHDWADEGAASTVGTYSLDLFGSRAAADMREGRTLTVRDVDRELAAADGADMFSAIGIKAIVCCPLVKENRLVAMMAVHQDAPRDWSGDEIALVEQVVDRSWAHIERVRVTEALRDSEAHLSLLFEQSAAGIVEVALDGRVLRVNDRYCRIVDRNREQLTGTYVVDIFHPEDREENFRLLRHLLETGEPFEIENRDRRPDGSAVWVSKTVSSIRTPDGKAATSVLAVVLDITERREAAEKVRHAALHDPLTGLPNRSMLAE